MISPSGSFRIFLASEPIDFRKGMDGVMAHVANQFELDLDLSRFCSGRVLILGGPLFEGHG